MKTTITVIVTPTEPTRARAAKPMSLTQPSSEPERKQRSFLHSLLPYTTAAMIVAALYVAWTFYSRYEANRRAALAIENRRAEENKRFVDQVYGSGEIKFTAMSANAGVLAPGQTTQLCYGVVNAKTVKIDPPVEQLKPSYQHCFQVAPKKTTTYTITAGDGGRAHQGEVAHDSSQINTVTLDLQRELISKGKSAQPS